MEDDDDFYKLMFPPYTGHVKIGEFYYDLYIDQDTLERTAEVVRDPTVSQEIASYPDLTTVRIPASVIYHDEEYIVTGIGKEAFSKCDINTVELPDTITNIGYSAFLDCMDLTSINLPVKVTCIEGLAFSGCWDLYSIELPDSLTSIGEKAFECCIEFTSIVIPASVSSIKKEAFGGCYGLVDIICKATVPPVLGDDVFRGINKSIPLYVPGESIGLYKTAPQWREFTNINAINN